MNDFYGDQMRSVQKGPDRNLNNEIIDQNLKRKIDGFINNNLNNPKITSSSNIIEISIFIEEEIRKHKSLGDNDLLDFIDIDILNINELNTLSNYLLYRIKTSTNFREKSIIYGLNKVLDKIIEKKVSNQPQNYPQPQQPQNYPQSSNYPQPSYQPQNNFENNNILPKTIQFSINGGRYYHNQKVFGDIDERYMLSNIPLINLGDSITLNARFGNYIKPINIEYSTSGFIIMTIEGQNITFPISSGGKQIVIGNRVPDGTRGKYIELGINISFPGQNMRRRPQY